MNRNDLNSDCRVIMVCSTVMGTMSGLLHMGSLVGDLAPFLGIMALLAAPAFGLIAGLTGGLIAARILRRGQLWVDEIRMACRRDDVIE